MKNYCYALLSFLLAVPVFTQAQFVQEKKISNDEAFLGRQYMNIQVKHHTSGEELDADIRVKGLNSRKQVVMPSVMDTTFEISNYRLYTVSCIKEGFMYYSEKFWPDEKQIHLQEVRLKPLAVGLKTDVRDITFLGDQTSIYHKSKPMLEELKEFLDLNPTIKVAIIGHVNGPDNRKSKKFYDKASQERAQAVIDYLIDLGVEEERLEVQGRGNTEMLFPDPKTDWQNEANRRVQIMITSI